MGSDSFQNIHRWKNFELLLKNYPVIIYDRPAFQIKESYGAQLEIVKAPMLDISSTYLREQIKNKKSIRYLTPDEVREYISENRYYQ